MRGWRKNCDFQSLLKELVDGKKKARIIGGNISLDDARQLAAVVASSATLTYLRFFSCGLGAQEVGVIADALRSNAVLAELEFTSNKQIGPAGVQALAEMIKVNTTLRKLSLFSCSVGDEGVRHLAAALRVNETLKELDLTDNEFTHVGIVELAAALSVKRTLRSLWILHNVLGIAGVEAIAKAVPHSGLCGLGLTVSEREAVYVNEMLKKGARLLELYVNGALKSRMLEEGFRCNGWLAKCNHPAAKEHVKRNRAVHEQARKSALTLCAIRRYFFKHSLIPYDIIKIIAEYLYSTRGDLN